MTDVCLIQPGERAAPEPTDSPSPGPVTVRYLTGTEDDRLFAGRMMVEAFEQKLVHATSRGRSEKKILPLTIVPSKSPLTNKHLKINIMFLCNESAIKYFELSLFYLAD